MILDELVLHNFGVYRGRQSFALTPESPDRPIVLIGAQNGAGKTTFLEGLQLAFFGRLGHASLRGNVGYEEYLRRSINRGVPPEDGAEVQVTFRRTTAGVEQSYSIRRAWSVQKGGVREIFEAVVDGALDRVLTEQWADFVEEMLPPRIAPLFFFDGEKIEQFADLGRSSEIISTAVSALLGLDIVERLELDLGVLERRKLAAQGDKAARAELKAAEEQVEAGEAQLRGANDELAAARTRRDRRILAMQRARAELKAQGGALLDKREALLSERDHADARVESARKDLRHWAAECAPLLLVQGLVAQVAKQASVEQQGESARLVLSHLTDRDARTLEALRIAGGGEALLAHTTAFFAEERGKLELQTTSISYLQLSAPGLGTLAALLDDGFPAALEARSELLEAVSGVEARRDDLERTIASIPAPETIAPLLATVTEAEGVLLQAEADVIACQRTYEVAERARDAARTEYQQRLNRHVQAQLHDEDAQRLADHSARVRETLVRFRAEVIGHHVHRIEKLILEALQDLLRKDDLIADVRIDPQTFAIELRGGGWDVLPPEQLSAGERQLFAIALLWALAKASGQAAPTVIDTPLGRLDSKHRARLVERYFPKAGDQVILLSTDEEIDQELFDRLEPSLSRSFTITYDADGRGSRVEAGYAFVRAKLEAA